MKNNQLTVVHENFFSKIINKLKNIFCRKKVQNSNNKVQENKDSKEELIKKLSNLKEEHIELQNKYDEYIIKLKDARLRELNLTLKIYQMQEFYLKKIKEDKLNALK